MPRLYPPFIDKLRVLSLLFYVDLYHNFCIKILTALKKYSNLQLPLPSLSELKVALWDSF